VQQPTRLELAINAKTEGAQDADSVQVSFDDGTRGWYGLMIGADGLLSKVRATLFPERAKAEIGLAARTFC
jgi:2-polyprenyl-6-methoxyphenol hydroxylase-like FAD-dependent oxidoreductase